MSRVVRLGLAALAVVALTAPHSVAAPRGYCLSYYLDGQKYDLICV